MTLAKNSIINRVLRSDPSSQEIGFEKKKKI